MLKDIELIPGEIGAEQMFIGEYSAKSAANSVFLISNIQSSHGCPYGHQNRALRASFGQCTAKLYRLWMLFPKFSTTL